MNEEKIYAKYAEKEKQKEYQIETVKKMQIEQVCFEVEQQFNNTLSAMKWKKQTCLTFLINLKDGLINPDSEWCKPIEDVGLLNTNLARAFVDMELIEH